MEIKKKFLQGWNNKRKYLAAKKFCNPIKNQMVHPLYYTAERLLFT